MRVNLGGIVPLSTVDWLGKAALVIFLRGCPLRCPHCHNQTLQSGESCVVFHILASRILCRIKGFQMFATPIRANSANSDNAANPRQISLEDASVRAASRPFVNAIVLSGGEPLMQPEACARLFGLARSLDIATGLETSGFYPDRLKMLLEKNLVDKVFLDLKTSLVEPDYEMATGRRGVATRVLASLETCFEMGVALDARSTIFPELPTCRQVIEIARVLEQLKREHPASRLEGLVLQQGHAREDEPWFEPVALEVMQKMAGAISPELPLQVRAPPAIKWKG